jgi:superfamily II DNA or RNA helicase
MSKWLSQSERDEAIFILKSRLTARQMRDTLDRGIEKMVATAERAQGGLYSSRLADEELAAFLVDLYGVDLLQNRSLRLQLTKSLSAEQVKLLAGWCSNDIPRGKNQQAEKIAGRKWTAGKHRARHFASTLGFPRIFAGIVGDPPGPSIETVEPHISLPDLHDYQQELLEQIHLVLRAPETKNRALLSLPTGAGKTRTVVESLLSWWGMDDTVRSYIVWIAQSDELCEQAVEAFREIWIDRGGNGPRKTLRLFRFWGGHQALPEAWTEGVIVASIQKLYEKTQTEEGGDELAQVAEETAAVIVDEAHHTTAPSYTAVLNTFGITFGRSPLSSTPLLGLTATPYRGLDNEENRRLANRFHNQLLIPKSLGNDPIRMLRSRNVLSQVEHRVLETERRFTLSESEQQRLEQFGQFPDSFLRKVGEDPRRNHMLLTTMLNLPTAWPVLFFGCSVDHASAMAVLLRRNGRSAAVVTATTRRATRRHLIEEFRAGRLQVLCNYGVLTTGFDAPKIRAVVIARPTTSVVLYEQMIGRGMRGPLNGGTGECLVIDLHDNIVRFQGQMAYVRMREVWG